VSQYISRASNILEIRNDLSIRGKMAKISEKAIIMRPLKLAKNPQN